MLRLILVVLVLVVLGLAGHGYYTQLYPKQHEVQTEKVVRADIVEQVAVSGTAEPLDRRLIQAEIAQGAVVEAVLADFNDPVKKGQELARLSNDEQLISLERAKAGVETAKAQKKAAEAGLKSAKAAFDGAKLKEESAEKTIRTVQGAELATNANEQADLQLKMAKTMAAGADSEMQRASALIASAEKGIDAARHMVRLAELQLQKTILKSPIDGFVLNMDIRVGDIVGRPKFSLAENAGAPFEIATPLDRMRAVVKLSEADYSKVRPNQKVTFTVEAYPDEKFEGKVVMVRNSPSGDRTAVTYPTVIEYSNRKDKSGEWMIRPRSTVSADIQLREVKGVLAVPNTALLFTPRQNGREAIPPVGDGEGIVWIKAPDGHPKPRKIKKGITNQTMTQLLDGDLKEGDEVITSEPEKKGSNFEGLPFGN